MLLAGQNGRRPEQAIDGIRISGARLNLAHQVNVVAAVIAIQIAPHPVPVMLARDSIDFILARSNR